MAKTEFPIPIHELDAGGKPFRFPIRPAWIRGVLEGQEATSADEGGELDVRVSKSGHDVVVHGTFKAKLNVPCARCLSPATVAIDEKLSVLMVPASSIKPPSGDDEERELTAEEADVFPYEGDEVALDDLVRDELILEIPMIPLCSETCPGISPPPQEREEPKPAEREIDPRLAPLLRFKKEITKE